MTKASRSDGFQKAAEDGVFEIAAGGGTAGSGRAEKILFLLAAEVQVDQAGGNPRGCVAGQFAHLEPADFGIGFPADVAKARPVILGFRVEDEIGWRDGVVEVVEARAADEAHTRVRSAVVLDGFADGADLRRDFRQALAAGAALQLFAGAEIEIRQQAVIDDGNGRLIGTGDAAVHSPDDAGLGTHQARQRLELCGGCRHAPSDSSHAGKQAGHHGLRSTRCVVMLMSRRLNT